MSELTARQLEWKAHLDAAHEQGVTLADYARTHVLNVKLLYYYSAQLRQVSEATMSTFVQVTHSTRAQQAALVIRLPNGVSISAPAGTVALPALLGSLAAL